jgi:hypothetical protein
MQSDIFGDPEPVEAPPVPPQHAADIQALPENLRPQCTPAAPVPTGKAELDEWTRKSQRTFLLWMIGALARGVYTTSSMASLPGVLQRLNGLAGEW